MNKLMSFKAVLTVLLGSAYVGGMLWGMESGKVDVQSFVAGIGPSFGAAVAFWFKSDES